MTNGNHDNKSVSSADILRYLSGEMSPAERHALEKQALDDPFLADAIEGMEQREPAELTQDFNSLSQRLEERVEEKKRRTIAPFYRVAAAAAVFLLAGSLSIIYFLNQADKAGPDAVANKLPEKGADATAKIEQSGGPQPNPASSDRLLEPDMSTTRMADSVSMPKTSSAKSLRQPLPPAPQKDQTSINLEEQVAASQAEMQDLTARREKSKETGDDLMLRQSQAAPVASRKSPDSSTVVVGYGVARRASRDSLPAADLAKAQNQDLQERKINEAVALKKKPASVSVTKASRQTPQTGIRIEPYGNIADSLRFRPSTSWEAYSAYLQQNMDPDQDQGTVTVQFSIPPDGEPKDVRIVQSTNERLNAGIINLIKNGARWKTQSTDTTVKVLIRF